MNEYAYITRDLVGLLERYTEQYAPHASTIVDTLKQEYGDAPRLSYELWCNTLESLFRQTGDKQLGLRLGSLVEPAHAGVLGYLSLSCETLGEAFVHFERYQRLLYGGPPGQTSFQGALVRVTWPFHDRSLGIAISDETLICGMASFIKRLCPQQACRAHAVSFCHSPLADTSTYQQLLSDRLSFDKDELYVEFDYQYLMLPIDNSDPGLRQLLDQQAQALLNVLPDEDDFSQQLKNHIIKLMQEGEPTLERAASSLCLSSRTLHRRLAERELNFASFLRQTRTELAYQYLQDPQLGLGEIAFLLGYSEQSAFSRAFKQWTGNTPSHYRKTASQGPN